MSTVARPAPPPHRARPRRRPSPDALALLALLAVLVVGLWDVLRPGGVTVGLDAVAFFYPMYALLGERLRAGDLPGWNPYQFAGAPFAGDPESGWAYLPAMLSFALLPLATAAKAFALLHAVLAGAGVYLLGRLLRMAPAAALTAAVVFAGGGFYADRARCCFAHVQVAAWLPWLLVGVELAARARCWRGRAAAWSLTGFALSQILAGWLGQGAYYALLALGAYLVYRVAIDPPSPAPPVGSRLQALPLHGVAVLAIGFGLAAAGLLPRLAYHARSNLAEGYAGDPNMAWAADPGGWPWRTAAELLLAPTGWYVGGAAAGLALMAPLVAGRRHAAPLFGAVALSALLLALEPATPLHALLYRLLPGFEDLHRHRPERVLIVWYLATALLAGATVAALPRWCRHRRPPLVGLAVLPVGAVGVVAARGVAVPGRTWAALLAACALVGMVGLWPAVGRLGRVGRVGAASIVLVVAADFAVASDTNVERGLFASLDLARWEDAGGAAAFLLARDGEPPFRFFGYDPAIASYEEGRTTLYRHEYRDPRTVALAVNNRATLLGLPDVQGYNPLQPRRFVEFVTALNGHPQEYHGAYVFPAGLRSPLLDLLNARYAIVPDPLPPHRADLDRQVAEHPTVFQGDGARVLRNDRALPRAWLVHDARRVDAGGALPLLAGGAVDPHRTALLEVEPPPLAAPRDLAADAAIVDAVEPDRLRLRTRSDAASLLVLSEAYDPGWTAEVDGEPAPVLVADHALRAVPVPAGAHRVELAYAPPGLRLGLAISLATGVAVATALAWAVAPRVRRRGGGASVAAAGGPVAGAPAG